MANSDPSDGRDGLADATQRRLPLPPFRPSWGSGRSTEGGCCAMGGASDEGCGNVGCGDSVGGTWRMGASAAANADDRAKTTTDYAVAPAPAPITNISGGAPYGEDSFVSPPPPARISLRRLAGIRQQRRSSVSLPLSLPSADPDRSIFGGEEQQFGGEATAVQPRQQQQEQEEHSPAFFVSPPAPSKTLSSLSSAHGCSMGRSLSVTELDRMTRMRREEMAREEFAAGSDAAADLSKSAVWAPIPNCDDDEDSDDDEKDVLAPPAAAEASASASDRRQTVRPPTLRIRPQPLPSPLVRQRRQQQRLWVEEQARLLAAEEEEERERAKAAAAAAEEARTTDGMEPRSNFAVRGRMPSITGMFMSPSPNAERFVLQFPDGTIDGDYAEVSDQEENTACQEDDEDNDDKSETVVADKDEMDAENDHENWNDIQDATNLVVCLGRFANAAATKEAEDANSSPQVLSRVISSEENPTAAEDLSSSASSSESSTPSPRRKRPSKRKDKTTKILLRPKMSKRTQGHCATARALVPPPPPLYGNDGAGSNCDNGRIVPSMSLESDVEPAATAGSQRPVRKCGSMDLATRVAAPAVSLASSSSNIPVVHVRERVPGVQPLKIPPPPPLWDVPSGPPPCSAATTDSKKADKNDGLKTSTTRDLYSRDDARELSTHCDSGISPGAPNANADIDLPFSFQSPPQPPKKALHPSRSNQKRAIRPPLPPPPKPASVPSDASPFVAKTPAASASPPATSTLLPAAQDVSMAIRATARFGGGGGGGGSRQLDLGQSTGIGWSSLPDLFSGGGSDGGDWRRYPNTAAPMGETVAEDEVLDLPQITGAGAGLELPFSFQSPAQPSRATFPFSRAGSRDASGSALEQATSASSAFTRATPAGNGPGLSAHDVAMAIRAAARFGGGGGNRQLDLGRSASVGGSNLPDLFSGRTGGSIGNGKNSGMAVALGPSEEKEDGPELSESNFRTPIAEEGRGFGATAGRRMLFKLQQLRRHSSGAPARASSSNLELEDETVDTAAMSSSCGPFLPRFGSSFILPPGPDQDELAAAAHADASGSIRSLGSARSLDLADRLQKFTSPPPQHLSPEPVVKSSTRQVAATSCREERRVEAPSSLSGGKGPPLSDVEKPGAAGRLKFRRGSVMGTSTSTASSITQLLEFPCHTPQG